MINRICISINNRCNLGCKYCHFHEKSILDDADMDVFKILDNVKTYAKGNFKIGFVGNGEGLLDWPKLKSYIAYLEDYYKVSCNMGGKSSKWIGIIYRNAYGSTRGKYR